MERGRAWVTSTLNLDTVFYYKTCDEDDVDHSDSLRTALQGERITVFETADFQV